MTQGVVVAAERLAEAAYAVFPCQESKAPACPGGFRKAARDPAAARELWRRYHGPLIGVATGEPSGFSVLDIDRQHDGGTWFAANRKRLPRTRAHRTRSGGLHLVFLHRDGLRCSAARIASGIDVRGDGGYVIWWPAAGLPLLDDAPLADWPQWLYEAAQPPPAPVPPSAPAAPLEADAYALAALRHASGRVGVARQGGRNATLYREACGLLRLPGLHPGDVVQALAYAARRAELLPAEIERTLASALRGAGRAS